MFNTNISKELVSNLKDICQGNEASLYMGLLAVLNALFYKYTNSENIVLGSAITARDHIDLKNQCGLYLNTLPLRTKFSGSDDFIHLLLRTKEVALKGYEHMLYPFDELVHDLQIERDLSRNVLFDVSVILHNQDGEEEEDPNSVLRVREYGVERNVSLFDLSFYFIEQNGELNLSIEYNTDIFEESSINQLCNNLKQLVLSITLAPKVPINKLDYLREDEVKEILEHSVNKISLPPTNKSVLDLFLEQVDLLPNRFAICYEDLHLTYAELDAISSSFASYLMESHKVSYNTIVGICLERSEWIPISVLGVMKAGATFVTFCDTLSKDALAELLEKSGCEILIDSNELGQFAKFKKVNATIEKSLEFGLSSTAYIMNYELSDTSIKSLKVGQSSFRNSCLYLKTYFNFSDQDNGFQYNSLGTDAFMWEVFPILISGGVVHIINDAYKTTSLLMKNFIGENKITYAILPSDQIHSSKIGKGETLKKLVVIGDFDFQLQIAGIAPENKFFNIYSPYASGLLLSIQEVEKKNVELNQSIILENSTLGTSFYILDNSNKLVPIGVHGNLYVEIDDLTYYHENQHKNFLLNPFKEDSYLLNTQDLAKRDANGKLVYLGRKSEEVQIKDRLINLKEIENCLNMAENISKCSVVVDFDPVANQKNILAFYAFDRSIDKMDNRRELSETWLKNVKEKMNASLPEYQQPTSYIEIPSLAFSRSKIDKANLLLNYRKQAIQIKMVEQVSEDDSSLATIWADILQINAKEISANDNFFDLGGKSMMFIQLKTSIFKEYSLQIELKDLFLNPLFKEQANIIRKMKSANEKMVDDLYFIPPIFGNPFVYMSLVEKVKEVFNTHTFQYLGLEPGERFFTSIIEAATYFSERVHRNTNGGKIILFGYSMGGNIAFEMIKILEEKFDNIVLVIVDSTAAVKSLDKKNLNFVQVKLNDYSIKKKAKMLIDVSGDEHLKVNKYFMKFIENNLKMAENYTQVGQIQSDIYCVKTEAVCLEIEDWKKFTTGKIDLDKIPGGHWTALDKMHNETFLNLLSRVATRSVELEKLEGSLFSNE